MKKTIIVGGVSGVGKTTIGQLLSKKMGLPFFDGDDYHTQSNVDKMKAGHALNDMDRQPWLENLADHIQKWQGEKGAVLACSALKESIEKHFNLNPNSLLSGSSLKGRRNF